MKENKITLLRSTRCFLFSFFFFFYLHFFNQWTQTFDPENEFRIGYHTNVINFNFFFLSIFISYLMFFSSLFECDCGSPCFRWTIRDLIQFNMQINNLNLFESLQTKTKTYFRRFFFLTGLSQKSYSILLHSNSTALNTSRDHECNKPQEIEDFIKRSEFCNCHRTVSLNKTLKPASLPDRPWQKVRTDILNWMRSIS